MKLLQCHMLVMLLAYSGVIAVSGNKLVQLSDNNFISHTAAGPVFVKFYAPWCSHSKKMESAWAELAAADTGDITIAEVDCTKETGLCSEYDVTGYPTLQFFVNGKSTEYTGGRNIEALKYFLSAERANIGDKGAKAGGVNYENNVAILTEDNFLSAVSAKPVAFVKFFAPWCGHCKKMIPAWQSLGAQFADHDDILIGSVDCTLNKAVCTDQGVRGYPTLLAFHHGANPAKFDGKRDVHSFVEFVEGELGAGTEDAYSAKNNIEVRNGLMLLQADTFRDGIASGWTFVKFYAPWCGHCKELAPIWAELAEVFDDDGDDLSVASVDCTVSEALCTAHGVKGYPTLMLFKDGSKVDTYNGERTLEALSMYFTQNHGDHDEL